MIDELEKMLREHSDAGLASEMITAHYPKTQHQEDECQICATVFRIATAALSQHEQRTAAQQENGQSRNDNKIQLLSPESRSADAAAPMSEERHVANVAESQALASTGSSDAGVAPGLDDVPPTPTPEDEYVDLLKHLDNIAWQPDNIGDPQCFDQGAAMAADAIRLLKRQRDEARRQLPEEMRDCTIVFEECDKGHGHLRGTNWVKHPCQVCRTEKAEAALAKINDIRNSIIACQKVDWSEHVYPLVAALQKRLDEAGKELPPLVLIHDLSAGVEFAVSYYQIDHVGKYKAAATEQIAALRVKVEELRVDAERWRLFEGAGHLMIIDFDRREAGSFKNTKRAAIDAAKGEGK